MNRINLPPITKNLLIINILFFILKFVLESKNIDLTFILGVFYFDSPAFQPWQILSYMFMHGSFAHIFFNMFALVSFGSVLESRWGAKKFLFFYLVTGLGALLLQMGVQAYEVYQITGHIMNPNAIQINFSERMVYANIPGLEQVKVKELMAIYSTPMVGASGAIFGLLAAFGLLYPNAELMILFIPVPVKAKIMMPIMMLIELSLGIANTPGDSVAHFAHIGGAIIGFILIKIWGDKHKNFYTYYE